MKLYSALKAWWKAALGATQIAVSASAVIAVVVNTVLISVQPAAQNSPEEVAASVMLSPKPNPSVSRTPTSNATASPTPTDLPSPDAIGYSPQQQPAQQPAVEQNNPQASVAPSFD
jgi:negative regulator of sigma E activity